MMSVMWVVLLLLHDGSRLGRLRLLLLLVELLDGLDLLLELHAPVLEPDLDLSLGEAERVGDLDPSPTRQVAVEVELLLQFQGLVAGVRLTAAFAFCKKKANSFNCHSNAAFTQSLIRSNIRREYSPSNIWRL